MTENAINMESRKNLVRSFMATMPVLTEATQDDLSQTDNSWSARSRRVTDANYGNRNPYEIEKARHAEAESRQRTTIQEHAARTFYTLNWAKQITNFGGVQMTNAEKAGLTEEMSENSDFYIRLMEMKQGRAFSEEEKEQIRKDYDRQRELQEKAKHAPLSEAEAQEQEQLERRLRLDEETIQVAEYCKKDRDQGGDMCTVDNLDLYGDDHPALLQTSVGGSNLTGDVAKADISESPAMAEDQQLIEIAAACKEDRDAGGDLCTVEELEALGESHPIAGGYIRGRAFNGARSTSEDISVAGDKRVLFASAPDLTNNFSKHASNVAAIKAESPEADIAADVEKPRTAALTL